MRSAYRVERALPPETSLRAVLDEVLPARLSAPLHRADAAAGRPGRSLTAPRIGAWRRRQRHVWTAMYTTRPAIASPSSTGSPARSPDRGAGCSRRAGRGRRPARARDEAGCAGHVLDFDDTYSPGLVHASAAVAPVALLLGAELGRDLGAVLDAYAAGFETTAALARAGHPALYERGWHPTAVCGSVGAAVAAARLHGLAEERTDDAVALALLRAGGLRVGVRLGRQGAAGRAGGRRRAAGGADRARAGARVPLAAVSSGPAGFEQVFGVSSAGAGDEPAIARELDQGISVLPRHAQRDRGGARAARARARTRGRDRHVHPLAQRGGRARRRADGLQAKFSIPYLAAFALLRGAPAVRDFDGVDAEVRDLARRVDGAHGPGAARDGGRRRGRTGAPRRSSRRSARPGGRWTSGACSERCASLPGERLDGVLDDRGGAGGRVVAAAGLDGRGRPMRPARALPRAAPRGRPAPRRRTARPTCARRRAGFAASSPGSRRAACARSPRPSRAPTGRSSSGAQTSQHDAEPQGLRGIEPRAREAQVAGDAGADRRACGRIARRDPDRQLRIAEGRALGGDPHVAQQREREPARERGPVDRGHDGLRAAADGVEGAGARLDQAAAVFEVAAELRGVHARAEGRPGAGQDDAGDPVVLGEPLEGVRELDAQVDRKRVALLRALQRDDGHLAVRLDRQQSRHGGQPIGQCGGLMPRSGDEDALRREQRVRRRRRPDRPGPPSFTRTRSNCQIDRLPSGTDSRRDGVEAWW